jgi:hypothetical protein
MCYTTWYGKGYFASIRTKFNVRSNVLRIANMKITVFLDAATIYQITLPYMPEHCNYYTWYKVYKTDVMTNIIKIHLELEFSVKTEMDIWIFHGETVLFTDMLK